MRKARPKSHPVIPTWNKVHALAVMKERGISFADVGKVLGLTRQAVGHWFRDRGEPSVEQLKKLAGKIGVPLSELLDPNAVIANTQDEISVVRALRTLPAADAARLLAFAEALKLSRDS